MDGIARNSIGDVNNSLVVLLRPSNLKASTQYLKAKLFDLPTRAFHVRLEFLKKHLFTPPLQINSFIKIRHKPSIPCSLDQYWIAFIKTPQILEVLRQVRMNLRRHLKTAVIFEKICIEKCRKLRLCLMLSPSRPKLNRKTGMKILICLRLDSQHPYEPINCTALIAHKKLNLRGTTHCCAGRLVRIDLLIQKHHAVSLVIPCTEPLQKLVRGDRNLDFMPDKPRYHSVIQATGISLNYLVELSLPILGRGQLRQVIGNKFPYNTAAPLR